MITRSHFYRFFFILLVLSLVAASWGCSKDKDKANSKEPSTIDLNEQNSDSAQDSDDNQQARQDRRHRRGDRRSGDRRGNRIERDRDRDNTAEDSKQNAAKDDSKTADKPPVDEQNPNAVMDEDETFDFAQDEPQEDPVLEVAPLLEMKEFREMTGYQGLLTLGILEGQEPSLRYNALRFSTNNAAELGFTLQVWKPGNDNAALKRFQDLYTQSFDGTKLKDIGNDAFKSEHHKLRDLCVYDRSKIAVIQLTCSDNICQHEQLTNIAKTILRRL